MPIAEQSSLRPERIAPPNDDVRATVQHVQKIALWMPRGIIIVFVAVPVLSALLRRFDWQGPLLAASSTI